MPTSARRRAGTDTRDRLLDVAYAIVRDEGLEALTIRHLAQRGGVAIGLPHAHFGSRDGLLDELRVRAFDDLDRVVDGVVTPERVEGGEGWRSEVDFERVITACVNAIVDFAFREPNLFELLMATSRSPVTEERREREMRTARRFVDFLEAGRARGVFHFASDPFVFSLALWTSMTGYVQRASADMVPAARRFHEKVLAEILEVYFTRIRVTPPPSS